MAQFPGTIETSAAPEIMPLVPLGAGGEELSRAVFAVNDAGNLTEALGANLTWIAEALTAGPPNADVCKLLSEAVDVCRQLTRLLGGAIGSCRTVARSIAPRVTQLRLASLIQAAINRVSRTADSMGILVLSQGPEDLLVAVDGDLMNTALETLLIRAVRSSPPEGVVRITFARSGVHAVIGLTSEGPGLTELQLTQLYTASNFSDAEAATSSLTSDTLRTISTMLFEQGGYIDAENHPDGRTTLFVVIPACGEELEIPVHSGTVLAREDAVPLQRNDVLGQKRSEKMIVNSDRFGPIEIDATDVLSFPSGIIGFPKENEFVLVRKVDSQVVGWLQSTQSSYLTLPVVSAHVLAPRFPDVPLEAYAERAGLGSDPDELAVLAVLSAPPGQPATVNLMAPIIVNAATRVGGQILIEGTRFTTRELFIFPSTSNLDLEHSATAMPNDAQAATSAAE